MVVIIKGMRTLMVAVLFCILLVPTTGLEAATLYMDPVKSELNRGDAIAVALRLDTDEGECVNTIDATINYTDNIQAIDTSRGDSILSVWLDEPKIDKTNRTITFAGGIPNGYCGRIVGDPRLTNTVMEIIFSSPSLRIGATESGNVASITYGEETRVLLNDGFGTDAPLTTFGAEMLLSKKPGPRLVNEWVDQVADDNLPPEEFAITLERSTNAFGNKYFVVFNTSDKQSGIDHYEVLEESMEEFKLFHWGATDAPWVKAKSPYVLKDQSLNSIVQVKAYDKAGNEYIAKLIPEESMRTMSEAAKVMIAIIVTSLIVFVLAGFGFVFYLRRRSKVEEEEISDEE